MVLESLRAFACHLATDSALRLSGLHFEAYASPEGPDALNRRLAAERRHALEQFVNRQLPQYSGFGSHGSAVYDRDALAAYRSADAAGRRRLVAGFAPLRYAQVTIDYFSPDVLPESDSGVNAASDTPDTIPENVEELSASAEPYGEKEHESLYTHKPLYIGLKTNMLYDAALIPTLGFDIYVGRNLSISGQWSYAWWSRNAKHRYWRFYGGDIGLRRWFGGKAKAKPLTGHHLGVYAQLFTYDFETGGSGQRGAKFNYGGGIEYGYSLPVGSRLNIDFVLGVGYVGGKYYKYTPVDGHYVWTATRRRNWVGPAKAEISLVWLIGSGNRNVKGGKR